MQELLKKINVPRKICDHLMGEEHTATHRMITGSVIMVTGVIIAKIGESVFVLHLFFDMGGYLIHAVGTIPFIERLGSLINKK